MKTFLTLLLIGLILFKLAGIGPVADWSWWWVLSPLWLPVAIAALIAYVASRSN